jgi:tRNA pseudouridine38-40 synthase
MRRGARHLLGEHDFSAFRAAHCDSLSVRRFMEAVEIGRTRELVEVEISANAFLRNMARIVTGTLVEVGLGRRAPDDVARVLAACERPQAGVTAPPQGLFLKEVRYP